MRPRQLLLLFVVAFGVRLVAAFVLDSFRHPQLYEYEEMARALLAGRGLTYQHLGISYHSYAAPLYPWICAGVYLATHGSVGAMLVVQMIVSAAHCAFAGVVTAQLAQRRTAGVAAGLLMALHPGLIVYSSSKGDPLPFTALFFMLILWQFWRLREQPTRRRAIEMGVIAGLGILCRPTAAVFLPLGGLWLLATSVRDRWSLLTSRFVLAAVCASAILLPWVVRNTIVNGQVVAFITTDAEDFWRGNNPHATGHSYVDANQIVLDTLTAAERHELRTQPNELAQASWFRTRAWAFIQQQPAAFVRRTLMKFYQFWWFGPQTGVLYLHLWLRAYQTYYGAVLAFAVVGLWTLRGQTEANRRSGLMLLFLVALSALQSLYYVEGRHRWAVEPFVLVWAGVGVGVVVARLWPRVSAHVEGARREAFLTEVAP